MNEQTSQPTIQPTSEWTNERANQPINEQVNEWTNERASQPTNEWTNEELVIMVEKYSPVTLYNIM